MDAEKLLFEKNVGEPDRSIRLVIGLVAFAAAISLTQDQLVKIVLCLIGMAGLYTGIAEHCTLYSILGFKSCPAKK